MKVRPRKVKYAFCSTCGKNVKFKIDWEGVVENTSKGIINYRELQAFCPECKKQIYVPAINDINVIRRNEAFKNKITVVKEELTKLVKDLETIDWIHRKREEKEYVETT